MLSSNFKDAQLIIDVGILHEGAALPLSTRRQKKAARRQQALVRNIQVRPASTKVVPFAFDYPPIMTWARLTFPQGLSPLHLSCDRCGARYTPQWRRGANQLSILCNVCGLLCAKHDEDGVRLAGLKARSV